MNARSRPLHHGGRAPIVGGVIAFGLILGPVATYPLLAQGAPPTTKGADGKAPSSPAPSPVAALRLQKLATRKARADYEIARLNREIAEIAVEEYAEGAYDRDLATVDSEIKTAESDLIRAEDRSDWARRMFDKGYVSKATAASEALILEKARFALEQARSRKRLLSDYTRPKTIKSLEAAVEKARKDELTKREAWEREVIRQADLERQLDRT